MSFIPSYFGKKFFKENFQNSYGTEDPYYEEIPAEELGRKKPGSKRRRAMPEGLSENDSKILRKVTRRAWRLDMCLGAPCGFRIGWSAILGLIPAIGDLLCASLALMIVRLATEIDGGLPLFLQTKMMANVAFDFTIGLVPIVGDIVNLMYKANSRNALLLEKYLSEKAKKRSKGRADPPIQQQQMRKEQSQQSSGWFGWGKSQKNPQYQNEQVAGVTDAGTYSTKDSSHVPMMDVHA